MYLIFGGATIVFLYFSTLLYHSNNTPAVFNPSPLTSLPSTSSSSQSINHQQKKEESEGIRLSCARTNHLGPRRPVTLTNTQTYRPPCANALVNPILPPEFRHCRRWSGINCHRRAHICKYA